MLDFSKRSTLPELMDESGVAKHDIHQALHELENVNTLLGGYSVILHALNTINLPDREIIIMDMGCGGGDMLRAIAKWANKKGRKVKLIGVDRNPEMTHYAFERSKLFNNISFITADVFDENLKNFNPDIVMNSLFCHHFDKDELIKLVKRLYELAKISVIINDLHRHWFAYYSIKWITQLVSKSYLVKYDAPLSVARSLTKNEWQEIFEANFLNKTFIKWMWAWRWQIIIHK